MMRTRTDAAELVFGVCDAGPGGHWSSRWHGGNASGRQLAPPTAFESNACIHGLRCLARMVRDYLCIDRAVVSSRVT